MVRAATWNCSGFCHHKQTEVAGVVEKQHRGEGIRIRKGSGSGLRRYSKEGSIKRIKLEKM